MASEERDPGWYYLHKNGQLIWKQHEPEPSDFVAEIYRNGSSRERLWEIILESLVDGADVARIRKHCERHGANLGDVIELITRTDDPSETQQLGLMMYLRDVVGINPQEFFDWMNQWADRLTEEVVPLMKADIPSRWGSGPLRS